MKLGPKLVVLTKGAKGADAFVPQKDAEGKLTTPTMVSVSPPGQQPNTIDADGKSVPVVDSVGAGDTFMGSLIMGCLNGPEDSSLLKQLVLREPWDDASVERLRGVMKRAAVAAAITCSRAGADPPTTAEVDKALSGMPSA